MLSRTKFDTAVVTPRIESQEDIHDLVSGLRQDSGALSFCLSVVRAWLSSLSMFAVLLVYTRTAFIAYGIHRLLRSIGLIFEYCIDL